MFTNDEIHEYSNLLKKLNVKKPVIPNGYDEIFHGGGKDGIQKFRFLSNRSKSLYVIWVEGTKWNFNDTGINLKTTPVRFYNGVAHKGYYNAARATIDLIQDYLKNETHQNILCLGHSLGGAISSIICTILNKGNWGPLQNIDEIRNKYRPGSIKALAFASPPSFSESIIKDTKKYITTIVSENDIVPKLGYGFDSLNIFTKAIVYLQMKKYNALGPKSKEYDINEFIKNNIGVFTQADRIPGHVVIIDMKEQSVEFGGNHREIQKFADLAGVKEHFYDKYYEAIENIVEYNDKVFMADKIQKRLIFQIKNEELKDDDFIELYEKIGDSFSSFVNKELQFKEPAKPIKPIFFLPMIIPFQKPKI